MGGLRNSEGVWQEHQLQFELRFPSFRGLVGAWTIFQAFSLFLRLECLNVDLHFLYPWLSTNRFCQLKSRFMSCKTLDGVFTKNDEPWHLERHSQP